MKILIIGSSGLIGQKVVSYFTNKGHKVTRLLRGPGVSTSEVIFWDPEKHICNITDFEGFDGVINLSGENIASGRWTGAKKQRIIESRVKTTQYLCECLAILKNPPKVFLNASAVGFYGNQGNKVLTEDAPEGSGFLADVCSKWERATEAVSEKGIRTVLLRFGMVLTAEGGGLGKMLIPFKLGFGGVLGSGKQYMSWIAIDDLVQIVNLALENQTVTGPINIVAPNPVTNEEFTKTLGCILHRPTFMSVPAFMAKLVFGEMADEVFLSSSRAIPKKLTDIGYTFLYPDLEGALKHLLG